MDPNACLDEIRKLVAQINGADACKDLEYCGGLGAELADHVEALDDWLSRGGFLPKGWDGRNDRRESTETRREGPKDRRE